MREIILRFEIPRAVGRAIRPDIRTGVLLSGGIDSSTVAVHSRGLPTFTGYYDGEPYDERRYANLVASDEHHEIHITPRDFVLNFQEMRDTITPPYTGPGMLGQFVVARYAAKHVEALLSGEGGDELFGGYARLLIVAGEDPPDGYEDYQLPADYPLDLQAALDHDFAALDELLRVDSEIAQAHGLVITPPLLDPEIVDYVLALPPEARVGKRLLKSAMHGIVPDAILKRTDKRGFPVPFVEWAQREPLKSFIHYRIGYIPDPSKPWAREWWDDLLAA